MRQPNRTEAPASGRGSMPDDGGEGALMPANKTRLGARPVTPRITVAEERVLRWVARGKTNKEIAAVLGISPATVKRHMEKILTKLGLRNRVEAAIFGLTVNGCPHQSDGGCALRQFETV